MVPRADVEIRWDIDFSTLLTPTNDDFEHGGFGTREYSVALVVDATWDNAGSVLRHEQQTVAELSQTCHNSAAFDEAAREIEGEPILDPFEGFCRSPDLGVFGASLALCSAGALTAASCRGHPSRDAWSTWPTILLTADREHAQLLGAIARQTYCGLASRDGRLEFWAQSLSEVFEFATELIQQQSAFDALGQPAAFHDVRFGA